MTVTDTDTDADVKTAETCLSVVLDRLGKTKAEGTFRHRRSNIEGFREWLASETDKTLLDVTPRDVQDHFDKYRQDHPDKTALGRLSGISAFYNCLLDNEARLREDHGISIELQENPAHGLLGQYENVYFGTEKSRREDGIVALTREEAEKLVKRENVPDPKTRSLLILKLFLQTGVRISELCAIRIGDIDRVNRHIRVRDKKNDRRRSVFYQPSVESLLAEWIHYGLRDTYRYADSSEHLIPTSRSESISETAVSQTIDKAAQSARIQEEMYTDAAGNPRWKVSAHTLRHTYARLTVMGENGIDIGRLAKLMGHRDKEGNPNISTTKKYLAFCDDDLQEASRASTPDI